MKHLVFLFLFTLSFELSAQTYFFNQISQEDGLRNGNVRAITMDYQGFMWIGTEDGLHRYDGYSMKIYRHKPDDSTSICNNFILCLYEDSNRNLWVGTLGGLCVYNRKEDCFRKYKLPAYATDEVAIRAIAEGKDNFLYVGSDNLFRAEVGGPGLLKFSQLPLPSDTISKPGIRVTSIQHDLDSNLLVSVNTVGLLSYNLRTRKSKPYEPLLSEKNIQTIYVDRLRNLIWLGTWGSGVIVYDPANERRCQLSKGADSASLPNNFIPSIVGDSLGNVWIATDNGLSLMKNDSHPFENGKIMTFKSSKHHPTGLSGNIIKSIYIDDQDRVWIGTYYEGLNVYDKHAMNFGSVVVNTGQAENGNIAVCETDDKGSLWLGLDGGGLYHLKGPLEPTNPEPPKVVATTENDKIRSMTISDDQNLWIGTWGKGLLKFNIATQKYTAVSASVPGEDIGDYIIALAADKSKNVWIGSFDKGIFRYDLPANTIHKLRSASANPNRVDRVNTILVDHSDNVWIGKEVGGLHFLAKGDTVYRSIISGDLTATTTIYTIYEDKSGILWISAPALGLIKYNPSSNNTSVYGEGNGLLNSSIYAIQEDSLNRLWISHNAGISVFDKRTESFVNFTTFNGLTSNQFNKNSSIKLKNGHIAFGNIKGLNYLDPSEFTADSASAPIVFTNLWINNAEQSIDGEVLEENIATAETVNLSHYQNSIAIEFAELDYDFSVNMGYAYILQGFDKAWQDAGNRRLISYTNLPPGTYTFKVKSANKGKSHELSINISPAWWQTGLFKVSLVLMIMFGAFAAHRLRIRFLVRQRKILENLVTSRTGKLNDANKELSAKIEEINSMNDLLQKQHSEIQEMNNEILAQNEELQAQNEQINQHKEQLENVNAHLEDLVDERTEKLKVTIKELRKAVFELDRFVYSASHDLSAPLKSIRGLIRIMNLEKDPAELQECVVRIGETVNKLEIVIQNMVNYSRNSHALIRPEPVNLKDIVAEVISELEFSREGHKIHLYNNLADDDLIIQTDRFRIKVILHNLIKNAIKFTDVSKTENWIKLEGSMNEKHFQLQITDNGIGIQDIYLDKIFNIYFRATEASDGSGLGLFIVKEMLDKIKGSISVKSEFGNFTFVELSIPNLK